MAPKRNQRKGKAPIVVDTAMADCIFPQDIMICILTRLPVKSLIRFKSVCKPWCNLFTTNPNFIKQHYNTLFKDPQNHFFMIYSLSTYHDHTMSLLKINSPNRKVLQNLNHPFPEIFFRMDFVGCCNGVVCMGCPPLGQAIVLWNPAVRMSKFVKLSDVEFGGVPEIVSLGFGYDDDSDDFKVVRIVCFKGKKKKIAVGVEVYSASTEKWKTIKVDCPFHVTTTKNETIVNENPCWFAKSDESNIVVRFDVKKMEFDVVPVPNLRLEVGTIVHLIDWKGGNLAVHLCCIKQYMVKYIDIWVLDEVHKVWCKKLGCGPIDGEVYRLLQCSKDGKFLGERPGTKLFPHDLESNKVEEIEVDDGQPLSFTNFPYIESLSLIKGMEPVVVKKEVEDEPREGVDAADLVKRLNLDIERVYGPYLQSRGRNSNAGAGPSNQ